MVDTCHTIYLYVKLVLDTFQIWHLIFYNKLFLTYFLPKQATKNSRCLIKYIFGQIIFQGISFDQTARH